jgi:hypothetical protein
VRRVLTEAIIRNTEMTFRVRDSKPKHNAAHHRVQPLGDDELERLETDSRRPRYVRDFGAGGWHSWKVLSIRVTRRAWSAGYGAHR